MLSTSFDRTLLSATALALICPAWSAAAAQDQANPQKTPLPADGEAQPSSDGVVAGQATPDPAGEAQPSNDGVAAEQATPESAGASGDIIVTAQRREERLSQVPISVEAASGDTLVRAGITDATAIQRISAAVSFTGAYNPESTSLAIRGVQSVSNEGGVQPSVAIVIDGVPVARQAEFIADLADIDRVEVLAGPQGTLFGKNSTGGVVNILTRDPKSDYGSTFLLEGTNDREVVTKASLNVPLSGTVAARVNGYYHYIRPLVENVGLAEDGLGQRSYGVQGKLLFRASSATRVVLTGNYNRLFNSFGVNFVIVPNSGPLGQFQQLVFGDVFGRGNDVFNQDTPTNARSTSYSLIGEINHNLTDELRLTSVSGYRRYKGKTQIDIDAGPVGYRGGLGYSPNPFGYPLEYVQQPEGSPIYDYRYFSQEFRLNYDSGPVSLVGGLFYQNFDETRLNFLPVVIQRALFSLNDVDSAISDDTYAAFADVTFALTDTFRVFGGLRYTHEKIETDFDSKTYFAPLSAFNPETGAVTAAPLLDVVFSTGDKTNNLSGRVGAQWRPAPNMNFYASYNRGYKGPAVNQGRDVVSAEGSILKPEIANAFEVGAKPRFLDGRLGFNVALYHQKIRNIQQASVIPGTILVSLLNAGDLKTKGFQVDAFAEPVRGLTLRSAVVYNNARYSGNGADGTPISFGCGPSARPGVGRCDANGLQSLVGQQAVGTPRWKVISSAEYNGPVSDNLRFNARVSYDWRSSIQYSLTQDPLTRESKAGFLDASIGIGALNDSWRLSVFGRNLTDNFYYGNLITADAFIGQAVGNLARDYRRYGGVRLETKF